MVRKFRQAQITAARFSKLSAVRALLAPPICGGHQGSQMGAVTGKIFVGNIIICLLRKQILQMKYNGPIEAGTTRQKTALTAATDSSRT